jgi:hypothetical protein
MEIRTIKSSEPRLLQDNDNPIALGLENRVMPADYVDSFHNEKRRYSRWLC